MPLIVCVCGGPAARGTENAYRGGRTVDTTTGGRVYVTCTTLRPRRPHGRRSRRRDRLLRGAGPGGRGQDVRRPPDAFRSGDALRVLEPGETVTTSWGIVPVPAP